MSEPYIGEIRMFGGNFAPLGWAFCNGATLAISQNDALFNLIGTTYGGDGQETFNLPDLQSRFPMHAGTGPSGTTYQIGERAGTETETLTVQQIPNHTHAPVCNSAAGNLSDPTNAVWAGSGSQLYQSSAPNVNLAAQALLPTGGSQPHENMAPFLAVSFIISLFGIFPQPT